MATSFFFYDLETSGLKPREGRIMQFAGQRTDMELNPVGEPVNILIRLTPDVVPDPGAVLLTGITPQMTLQDGVTEVEFLQYFYKEVVKKGTIFLGYNTVRFDDEFMRYLHYRNFYDAYEWQWCDECSRWDLLDVVRMTRALRPDGIKWPVSEDGAPNNRLEKLTTLNGLVHDKAHDAMSDVLATIAVARMIRDKQPKLFQYLLDCRGKKECKQRIDEFQKTTQPFLYTSGRYPKEFGHTTATLLLAHHVDGSKGYVYDLRVDPTPFLGMSVEELMDSYTAKRDSTKARLAVKVMKYNRCPAIAPIGALQDKGTQERLQLSLSALETNRAKLRSDKEFSARVIEAIERAEAGRDYGDDAALGDVQAVDGQLYGGNFFSREDKRTMEVVRSAPPDDCAALEVTFQDERLQSLFPLFKARNYSRCLHDDERADFDAFCRKRLLDGGPNSRLAQYFKQLEARMQAPGVTENERYLLEELRLYGESIMPAPDGDE